MSQHVQANLWGEENPEDSRRRRGLAPNGEGTLAAPDAGWVSSTRVPGMWESFSDSIDRLGLNRAMEESHFVCEVFVGLVARITHERHEQLLDQVAQAAALYAQLSDWEVDGTLAGEFIRWCEGQFPDGVGGDELGEVLAGSGSWFAEAFRTDLESRARP